MRVRFNYIFFFLIFLSLFGLGNDQSLSRSSIKYLKETEWISKPNSINNFSKCIHFHLVSSVVSSTLSTQLWEKEYRNSYDRKLRVHFLVQTRLFKYVYIKHLISIKRYIPRLFTDDHQVSYRRLMLIEQRLSTIGIPNQVRNFIWKHLLNRKWINQKRKLSEKGRDFLNGYLIGFL